jgi:YesN/AraC family two-component response regulator
MYGIYIVDDEKLVVNDLINSIPWLENGFEVIGSNTNALTAITEITAKKPDVVCSDLKMPACDGIELIRRIKENGVDTEFVMLSAYEDFKASREFFLMGGIDYILKPLDINNAALILEKLSRKLASKNNQSPTVQFVPSQSKSFDDIVTYVTSNFSSKHTLKDLSEKFNMNQTYICDLFSKQYDSTLTIFVTNLRMKEADRLILETDTPFKEIALFCGYPNYYHFCKVFKTHFGRSPSQHRGGG